MNWLDNLKRLKSLSRMTTKEIANKSDIPEATLEKIFSGTTKNPGINTIYQVVHIMGYTLDDIDPSTEKKSPGADESAPGDKKIDDIMGLVSGLDDSQKVFLVALLEKVHERNQQTHPTAQVSISSAVPESVNPGQT